LKFYEGLHSPGKTFEIILGKDEGKGKAIPLQTWTGP
jgi:hypothetical protein